MTRTEFFENIGYFGDLKEFCWENNCYLLDDVISDDDRDEEIYDELREGMDSWRNIRDWLNGLDTGYDWWNRDGGNYIGMDDDDFDAFLDEVAEWAESHGVFDPEDEEPEENVDTEADAVAEETDSFCEDEEPIEEEDFTVGELFSESSSVYDELEKARASLLVLASA